MASRFKVFREYTRDDSFINLVIPENVTEFQVCLSLARDYVGENSTNGKFIPYWDTESVTAEVIKKFKKKKYESIALTVKVLVTIGNSNKQFPFTIGSDTDAWVSAATDSLKDIIKGYHLDGIDVYYEDIAANQAEFVHCIGEVVKTLKENRVITVASIAPNATTINDNYYFPLFQNYNKYFDIVVFQSFTGFVPAPTNPVKSLEEKIIAVATQYESVHKFLVGYSALKEDFANISPSIFFIVLHGLLPNPKVKGSSLKVISGTIASFPPLWIPDVLSLAASQAAP